MSRRFFVLTFEVALLVLFSLITAGANATANSYDDPAQTPENTRYKVVVNTEEQYSIWPADRENPLGWRDGGFEGTKGECIAHVAQIWESQRPPKPTPSPSPTETPVIGPTDFRIPDFGQNGRPVEIKGPFDGDIRTTEIRVGGQPVTPLAESSRSCFFISPNEKFGSTEITVQERNVEVKGTCRILSVELTADKLSLRSGEKSNVLIKVKGGRGVQQNVNLLLETIGAVNMEGGNVQNILLRPSDFVVDGVEVTANVRKVVVGLRPGAFNINATVIDPNARPVVIPLSDNQYQVKKEGPAFVVNLKNVKHPITGDPVNGKHKLEHKCPELSKLPYVKSLFLNKGIGRTESECLIMVSPRIIIIEDENGKEADAP
jgi:MbtH protein